MRIDDEGEVDYEDEYDDDYDDDEDYEDDEEDEKMTITTGQTMIRMTEDLNLDDED